MNHVHFMKPAITCHDQHRTRTHESRTDIVIFTNHALIVAQITRYPLATLLYLLSTKLIVIL